MPKEIDKYRDIINKAPEIDSLDYAIKVLDAYHRLEELGSDELEGLRFEYVIDGIENRFLEKTFEYHLDQCFDCLQKTSNLKHFVNASETFGDQVIARVEVEELMEEAKGYSEVGKYEEAIKCLKKAEEMKPGNKEISYMLKEAQKRSRADNLKEKFQYLIKVLKGLKSEVSLPHTIFSFDGVRGSSIEVESYNIGETIHIILEIPKEIDGYLAIFDYDNEYNLRIIHPKSPNDVNRVKSGTEKDIEVEAKSPKGKHYLKAILTTKKLIKPEEIDFDDDRSISFAIEEFIKLLSELGINEWAEAVAEYEVID